MSDKRNLKAVCLIIQRFDPELLEMTIVALHLQALFIIKLISLIFSCCSMHLSTVYWWHVNYDSNKQILYNSMFKRS